MGMTLTNSFLILNFWCHQFWLLLRVMVRGWGWGGESFHSCHYWCWKAGWTLGCPIFSERYDQTGSENLVINIGKELTGPKLLIQTFAIASFASLFEDIPTFLPHPPPPPVTTYIYEQPKDVMKQRCWAFFWGELCALTVSRSQCSICWLMTFYWWLQSWATC